jgi:4-hydroxybenzoate polyprenyltransferase
MATSESNRPRTLSERFATTTFASEVLPQLAATLADYGRLMRLDRPIGTFLLLWPALWALWLASAGKPDPHVFIVFALGVFLMRSAGCVINDFADRKIDPHVRRTRERPLAQGRVEPGEAVMLFIGLALIALGLVLTLDRFTQQLALVGAVLTVTYPFFKRFFPIPQIYLGLAFSWSVPMAYAAQAGEITRIAWLLFMAAVLWTTVYDTMYAMVDREDDLKIGIRSSAILFGDADRFIIAVMQLMTLLALWLVGRELELGNWYRGGLAAAACFALYQQWLIRDRIPDRCFRAFLNSNYFGMTVFIGIALEYVFRA